MLKSTNKNAIMEEATQSLKSEDVHLSLTSAISHKATTQVTQTNSLRCHNTEETKSGYLLISDRVQAWY